MEGEKEEEEGWGIIKGRKMWNVCKTGVTGENVGGKYDRQEEENLARPNPPFPVSSIHT